MPHIITDQILDNLSARQVLDLINYRTETIIENSSVVKVFCPIHEEMVFRTLILDPKNRRFKCSYSLCPGHAGGDLIELYSKAMKVDRLQAMKDIRDGLNLKIKWDDAEAAKEAKSIQARVETPPALKTPQAAVTATPMVATPAPEAEEPVADVAAAEDVSEVESEEAIEEPVDAELTGGEEVEEEVAEEEAIEASASLPDTSDLPSFLDDIEEAEIPVEVAENIERPTGVYGEHDAEGEEPPAPEAPVSPAAAARPPEVKIFKSDPKPALIHEHIAPAYQGTFTPEPQREAAPESEPALTHAMAADAASNDDPLAQAVAMMEAERWAEADKALERILAHDSQNLIALRSREQCLQALGHKYALAAIEPDVIAAALAANDVRAAQNSFRTLCEVAEDVETIISNLNELLRPSQEATAGITPLVEGMMARAERSEGESRYDEAITLYRAVEPFAPPELDVSSFIINLLGQTGATDTAVSMCQARLDEAREADNMEEQIRWLRAMIDCDPGRVDIRQEFIEIAIQDGLTPEIFHEVLRLIDGWLDEEEWGLAREALELLGSYLPTEIEIYQRLCRIVREQGDLEIAATMTHQLARLCREANKPSAALAHLEALPHSVDYPENLKAYAQCCFEAGQVDRAVELLRRLAEHFASAEEMEQSEPLYQTLSTWQPDEPRWRVCQGNCLRSMGDSAQALTIFEQAGMDFLSLGRLEESADVLGEALNIDAAATDIAQLQHNLLQQLGRQAEADELMQSTVAYLRTNRSAAAAAEFLIGCAGDPELTVDSTVALANLWQEADEAEKACEAIRHGMARASREENIEGQFALARRLIEIDPNDTEATGILLRHTASTAHDAEQRTLLAQLGENCMAAGNWGRATEAFVRLAEIAPDDETILSNLIRCHETCNEPEKAVRLRLHLGQSHFDAENWAKCAEALAPLAAGDALDTQALENLFQCHTRLNQKQEATEVGERLMQAAEKAGDAGAAIATIEQILELCPEDGSWRSRLFQWQLRAGQREDAVETGRTVLSHAIGAGDADRAREIAAQLVSLAPDDCKLRGEIISAYDTLDCSEEANRERLALAEVNRRAGAADEAQALYQQVLKSDPDSRAAGEGLLELHISVGDREGAVELLLGRIRRLDEEDQAGRIALLERLLQIDSDHTESRRRLVDLLRSQVRNDEAVEQLATLAQQLHDAGDHTEAIAAWEEVISLRPEVIPYHQALITSQLTAGADEQLAESVETLMRAMIARNEASEALECLDRFASYNPEIPLWARWRAEVLSEMGDSAQAVDAFRQAVALMQTQGATARPETREPANTRSMSFLPECTFDSFIIGDRNNFAHATCKAVAESPAKTYNPLFLYADVGLGKTHLVNAIGNHIQTNHPDLKILFITMEDFITGLVDAIQRNQIAEFRARHRRADVLLIDDVQFLANKERAQEEFFHLFNALHQSQRQIVITSDRPPREMTYLEKRLRSRFGAGVVVDIQSPDVETRLAILRQIAAGFEDTNLSDEVLALAAERCTSNVRELKGALTQLVAHAATNGGKLSAEQASHVLDQIIEPVES